jgi:hypothetical protein
MSTPRRLFEDPRNTYIVDNNDPGAFDKRFVGRPGVHREQRCCRDRAPVWQSYLIHDGDDPGGQNRPAYKTTDGLLVEDATGEHDNISGPNDPKGYVWVEGPNSGYKPDFISPDEWMRWQSVYWMPSPRRVPPNMPNPPRWVRIPGERKLRWRDGNIELLWCQKCETALESTWSDILEALPIAARGIAMVASYVPVYGTALSLAINSTVSLAQGESIDQSVLDGIGGALPGQPTSGMVFHAGVSIGKGERIDHVFIDTLHPLDNSVKVVLKAAADTVYNIASGQNVTDVTYNAIHQVLPPEAQQGMDYARRVINGENVPEMILSEAEQMVVNSVRDKAQFILEDAKDKGPDALIAAQAKVDSMFNQYAVEFGYQMALDRLPAESRGWVQLGLAGGGAMQARQQFVGTFGWIPERNTAVNDGYEAQGKTLIASGIKYKTKLVSDILRQSKFAIVIDFYDSLNSVWTTREMKYYITDAWRRGFIIAIGACEGRSVRGPGQLGIYQSLAEGDMRAGFDAGQAVQYNRSLYGESGLPLSDRIERVPDSPFHQAPLSDRVRVPDSPFRQAQNDSRENPSG